MRRWIVGLTVAIAILSMGTCLLQRLDQVGASQDSPELPLSTRSGYVPLVIDSSTWTPTPTATHTPTPTSTNTPLPTATATPIPLCPGPAPAASPLPDLAITHAGFYMQGWPNPAGCMETYGPLIYRICVANLGAGDAGCFVVVAGDLGWRCEALASGEERCWEGETTTDLASVDVYDDVLESDEDNNTRCIPVPTPPPKCRPAAQP